MANENALMKEFQKLVKNFNMTHKSLKKVMEIYEEELGLNKDTKSIGRNIGITKIMELSQDNCL